MFDDDDDDDSWGDDNTSPLSAIDDKKTGATGAKPNLVQALANRNHSNASGV